MKPATIETCATCAYYLALKALSGTCVRYPPEVGNSERDGWSSSKFPEVNKTDWCGEFKK